MYVALVAGSSIGTNHLNACYYSILQCFTDSYENGEVAREQEDPTYSQDTGRCDGGCSQHFLWAVRALEVVKCSRTNVSFSIAPIFLVSNVTGESLDLLRSFLNLISARTDWEDKAKIPAKMHIDNTFSVPGVGTVVSGTLVSGSISMNETVGGTTAVLRLRAHVVAAHVRAEWTWPISTGHYQGHSHKPPAGEERTR